MKFEYSDFPSIRIFKSGIESNSYPDLPNYWANPDLWICFFDATDNYLQFIVKQIC